MKGSVSYLFKLKKLSWHKIFCYHDSLSEDGDGGLLSGLKLPLATHEWPTTLGFSSTC